jgi:hypothetical protein
MLVSPNKFDPKEIENSKRIFKSATPKYTVDWYIKWVASFLVLGAMSVRGLSGFELWDLTLSIAGVSGWLIVAVLWKDRALIMINSFGLVFLLRNLVIALTG